MMGVNLKGAFFGCQAVVPLMKQQRGGRIINFSSISARTGGLAAGAHYAASKAGVISLTKSVARELAPYGGTCNAIAPSATATPLVGVLSEEQLSQIRAGIPLGRIGEPSDMAATALFLASDEACFITGQTLDVNGGSWMG